MQIVSAAKTIQGMHMQKLLRDLKIKLGFHRAIIGNLITKSCLRAIEAGRCSHFIILRDLSDL